MGTESPPTQGMMSFRGMVHFRWLVVSLVVWSLPLVSPSSPSPPPDLSPPPFVDPLLPTQPEPIQSVGVASVVQYLTYVLCAIAGTIVVGSLSAGAGHLVSSGQVLVLILNVALHYKTWRCWHRSAGSCLPRPHFLLWTTVNSDIATFQGG